MFCCESIRFKCCCGGTKSTSLELVSVAAGSAMPYVLISTQIRLENGPTICGDSESDPELMAFLDAQLIQQIGNNFAEYRSVSPARQVLCKLEEKGYKVVAMTGVGQTCIWTCYKEKTEK